jgi:hypothetical protein
MQAPLSDTKDIGLQSDILTTTAGELSTFSYVEALSAIVEIANKAAAETAPARSDSYSNGTLRPGRNSAETADTIQRFLPDIAEAVTQRPIPPLRPNSPIRILKRYEGYVTSVQPENFIATIWEHGNEWPRLEAEFPIDVVEQDDLELLQANAPIFVMSLEIKYFGEHWARSSMVRFRRVLPVGGADIDLAYTKLDIDLFDSNHVVTDQETCDGQ